MIPESNRGDVVLQRQIAAVLERSRFGPPSERLHGDAQIAFEANWIREMPAIEPEALLALVYPIRSDDLRQAGIGGGLNSR